MLKILSNKQSRKFWTVENIAFDIIFNFSPKTLNVAANFLAKFYFDCSNDFTWTDSFVDFTNRGIDFFFSILPFFFLSMISSFKKKKKKNLTTNMSTKCDILVMPHLKWALNLNGLDGAMQWACTLFMMLLRCMECCFPLRPLISITCIGKGEATCHRSSHSSDTVQGGTHFSLFSKVEKSKKGTVSEDY